MASRSEREVSVVPQTVSGRNPAQLTRQRTGSTPLHFAAANGHLLILSLLLSYGADPRVPEKHGATAEQMAAQNGFLDAADLLHSYSVKLDQAAAEANGGNIRVAASSSSTRSHRHGSGRTFASLRRKSSLTSSGSTPAMQAQRSFDALATKFAHHAHRASSSSSLSVNSLRGGLTPLASSSQISLGAADGPAPLVTVPVRRRPSLPGGTMQPVLEVGNDGRVRAATFSGGSGQQASMSTAFTTSAPQAPEQDAAEGEDAVVERAERRRSMDVNRPWRQDSFQTGLPTLASLDMAALTRSESDDPDPTPTDSKTALMLPTSAPASPTRTLPPQRFYRPRQSSGLSRGSFTGSRPSIDEDSETRVFEEDDEPPPVVEPVATTLPDETTTPAKPNRPRAVSNPDSRSPLLQHLHATQYSGARSPRSRENSQSETNAPAKQGQNLAVPSPTAARATQSDGRARSNSTSTDASYTVSTSSSRDSTWSGPTFSTASTSTAPTTAPPHSPTKRNKSTTVTPDAGYFSAAAATTALDLSNRRRHLGPLYEAHSPGIVTTPRSTIRTEEANTSSNDHEPKTRAQARSRVKKAERELMGSLAPSSASASTGPTSVLRETAAAPNKSLKDQLAAYGKSLRAERELVEKEERERQRHVKSSTPAASGYTIETISTSGVAKGESSVCFPCQRGQSANSATTLSPLECAAQSTQRVDRARQWETVAPTVSTFESPQSVTGLNRDNDSSCPRSRGQHVLPRSPRRHESSVSAHGAGPRFFAELDAIGIEPVCFDCRGDGCDGGGGGTGLGSRPRWRFVCRSSASDSESSPPPSPPPPQQQQQQSSQRRSSPHSERLSHGSKQRQVAIGPGPRFSRRRQQQQRRRTVKRKRERWQDLDSERSRRGAEEARRGGAESAQGGEDGPGCGSVHRLCPQAVWRVEQ